MGHVRLAGTATVNATATSGSITVGTAVPAGRTLVGGVVWDSAAGAVPTITSISDSRGNVYTVANSVNAGTTLAQILFYATVTTPLQAGDTVTVVVSAGRGRWAMQLDEFDDVAASPFDQGATNAPGSSASLSSGVTAATTEASELVYCVFGFGQGRTVTIPSGWSGSAKVETTAGSSNRALQAIYRYVSASGPQEGTLTLSTASTYAGSIATFKLASGPPPVDGGVNVRSGGAWVTAVPYVRSGGSWVQATAYVLSGGSWQEI
ncbi:hypothetical protein GCM10010466_29450 [Planomonospora alba]|uniref:Uncharacterized protein n=1 Tax=Planomonospora alba TaxID=161354 RepID=A0ABP6N518_9ACTN